MKRILRAAIVMVVTIWAGCGNRDGGQLQKEHMTQDVKNETLPTADQWVDSPLRNRLTLKLDAPLNKVWDLVGDPSNMPRFSAGLSKVENKLDAGGNCVGYTCYFKPMEAGQEGIIHFSEVIWHEKNAGWASMDSDDNPFGTKQSISLLTLAEESEGTILTWQFHYNCVDDETMSMNKNGYFTALADISERLLIQFGGREIENYVEAKNF